MELNNDFIERYGRLEMAIQEMMKRRCGVFCAACADPCCRIDFCRESLESPFLEAVRGRFALDAAWDTVMGWLTPNGCGLAAGRPPVCYEFLCGPIISAQKGRYDLEQMKLLSMLITVAGRRARGNHHLIELVELSRVNWTRLSAQVLKSQQVLTELVARAEEAA